MRHICDMCLSLEISEDKITWKEIARYGNYLLVLVFSEISRNNVWKRKITGESNAVLSLFFLTQNTDYDIS